MKFQFETGDFLTKVTDLLVLSFSDEKIHKDSLLGQLNSHLKGEIEQVLKDEEFKGKAGDAKLLYTKGKIKAKYVLILGLGKEKDFNQEVSRKCSAVMRAVAEQIKAKNIISEIHGSQFHQENLFGHSQALAEGLLLSAYKFSRYLKVPSSSLQTVSLLVLSHMKSDVVKKAVHKAELLAKGVYLARDMVNTPAQDMTPEHIANIAKGLKGVESKIHNLQQIKKMKMGAFLGVAQGSTANPPYFIEMHYKPKTKAKKKIALIGKGVTFDSGGLSIKPAKGMETMKDDMSGAAAVVGLMSIISQLAPNVEVSGYVAATENMVDGHSLRPGDIVTAMNGKTIEVLNTDAEGRLTLADAMTYALKNKPDYMIDMATLTGACLVALGMLYSGIMGNDQDLMSTLIAHGEKTGEHLWQLPLVEDYKDQLKSNIADLKNIGSGYGGTITAGLFLEVFAEKTKWAHLDIAGPAWTDSPLPYIPKGGSGVMVRTLAEFLLELSV